MDKKPLISIIMPVYGVEEYVGKAIESVQNQTVGDWEFLIVDDGTKDRSGEICDEYAAKDARLKVFHNENGGAPVARNYAMDRAVGKYYYFMDSDDWIEPTMFEDLLKLAEDNDAQLVVSGFYIDTYYNDEEYFTEDKKYKDVVYPSQQAFREDAHNLFERNQLYTPWNKLYLRSYIEERNIRFQKTFWDDFPFVLDVIRDIERVVVTEKQYYHFIRKRQESETTKYREGVYEKREEEHGWMVDLYEHWGVDHEASKEMIALRYLERLIGCIENVTCDDCKLPVDEKKAQIKKMIETPQVKESLQYAKPKSRYLRWMLHPLKTGNYNLAYMEGRLITFVKKRNVKTFAKLKARR